MHVAVIGCCHGLVEEVYDLVHQMEKEKSIKIDLLIMCGDYQAIRNEWETKHLACPEKYRKLGTFVKYYRGVKVAPILTIVIGGNHEASLHNFELYRGGWFAPNIYFMGYAGVINYNGLRIAGQSGIYKDQDFFKGHYEAPPFIKSPDAKSVYHVRDYDTQCLLQLKSKIHIVLTHDWPLNITNHGNKSLLIRRKPFFEESIRTNTLGSVAAEALLRNLKPDYFFSAHLHCKFPAVVNHDNATTTKFLALGKILPNTDFMQVLSFPAIEKKSDDLTYDLEWLSVLRKTNNVLPVEKDSYDDSDFRSFMEKKFSVSRKDLEETESLLGGDLTVPLNFSANFPEIPDNVTNESYQYSPNPQTVEFFSKLKLEDMLLSKFGCFEN